MKIGFACGMFDLFHPGHVLMLKECKEHCDFLIVALNTGEAIDPEINPNKRPPILNLEERKMILDSCRYVDKVLSYRTEEELKNLLKNEGVNIRFLGDDYKGKLITGEDLVMELYYTDRSHGWSSTKIYERIKAAK